MYRIVLKCRGIPANEGPSGAENIQEEFTQRPWHTSAKCEWSGSELILQAENDHDSNGQALMDEFSDAISACISDAGDGGVEVVSVTALSEGGS